MKINEVEQLSGISKKNIRFYEQEGLLKPDRNHENGYREYTEDDVETLKKIKLLRKLSVPLDEIRKIQQSQLTLTDCMQRHLVYLQREEDNLKLTREICNDIITGKEQFDSIEINHYLEEMDQMEKNGANFEHKEPIKSNGRSVAVICCALFVVAIFLAVSILFWVLFIIGNIPLIVAILASVVPTVVIIAVLTVMIMRIKEITGGEEDEAAKY